MDTPAAASDGQRRSPRIQEIAARTSPSAPSASITAATAPSTAAPANAERPSSASTGNGSPASSAAAPVAPPSSSEPIAGASGVQKAPRRRPDHDPRIKNSVNVGKRMPVAPVEDDEEEEDSEEEDAEEEEEDEDDQEEEDPQPPAKRRRTGGTSATSVAAEPAVAGVFCEGSVAYFDTTNAVLVETPTQTFVSGQWHGRFLMPVSNFRGADLSGIPIAGPTHPDRRLPVGDVEEKNRALYERHMEKCDCTGLRVWLLLRQG
ncbi:nucleolin-like [Paramacrobiotus metropolitanus]|uniref:nucleolin-like n=1 Tax=Paramacrobiotus metropolitanus TaxID=2943436 RepID=UPI0024458419|nr:nucleolin-like [Paramacrobiotus metropolitanus]